MVKRIFVFLVMVFIGFSCGSDSMDLSRVKYGKVKKGDMTYSITATGTIKPLKQYEIKSIASGKIISMPVDTGSYVRRGGLICRLDPSEEKNNYDEKKGLFNVAKISLVKAEANLKRQQSLFTNNFIPQATLEDYKLKLAQAKSGFISAKVNKENALKRYNETRVTAPISGTILEKNVEEGQVISSGSSLSGGTTIVVIANLSGVYIKAYVAETDIANLKLGQEAIITLDAYPDKKFKGEVYKIEPLAVEEQNVTSFLVTVKINNPKKILKPGMNASVEITTEKLTDILTVPYAAVKRYKKKTYLFIKKRGKIIPQKVKSGKTNFTDIEIQKGIKEGARIVISGLTDKMVKVIVLENQKSGKKVSKDRSRRRRRR